jgi:hypothetical protein
LSWEEALETSFEAVTAPFLGRRLVVALEVVVALEAVAALEAVTAPFLGRRLVAALEAVVAPALEMLGMSWCLVPHRNHRPEKHDHLGSRPFD